MRALTSRLMDLTRWVAPPGRDGWSRAMQAELHAVPAGSAQLRFAAGCLAAATGGRLRVRAAASTVRVLGLAVVAVSVVQGGVETGQWRNGNDGSRLAYAGVVAVVLVLAVLATLRVTARGAQVDPTALTVGAVLGTVAAGVWTAVAYLAASMPRGALGAVGLIAVAAAAAGTVVAIRTRTARQGWLAALVAALTGVSLTFVAAELLIQVFPAHIPDIVGPAMPAGSTAVQVLRENRIEIVDGYVVLLFLAAALSGAAVIASYLGRPRRTHDTSQHTTSAATRVG
jgi:hypothetical protein